MDCGSNIGHWSIFASTVIDVPDRIIAIEPSQRTFRRLEHNATLNDKAFRCVRAAVFSESDLELTLKTHVNRHAGDSVKDERGMGKRKSGYSQESIRSVTIDTLLEGSSGAAVIKLDIEGAEIEALKGASQTIKNGSLFIYEDHWQNPDCKVTKFIIGSLGLDAYLVDDGGFSQIRSAEELRVLRKSRPHLVDFVALGRNSPFIDVIHMKS